jgi:hypothetical protein
LSESWWPVRTKQFEEPRRGEEIAAAILQRLLGFGVGAPLLGLPALIQGDGVPGLLSRYSLLRNGKSGDPHERVEQQPASCLIVIHRHGS